MGNNPFGGEDAQTGITAASLRNKEAEEKALGHHDHESQRGGFHSHPNGMCGVPACLSLSVCVWCELRLLPPWAWCGSSPVQPVQCVLY